MAKKVDLVIDGKARNIIVISVTVDWLATLAGYDGRGSVKESQTIDGPVLASFDAYMTVDDVNSLVILDLPADVTGAYTWTTGHYDLKLVDGNPAHDVRFLQGEIRVDEGATT